MSVHFQEFRALVGVGGSAKWIDNFGIQILIYIMLGWGLNIVVGLAGLLDLGYVAFYAVGAYSYALLAKEFLLTHFFHYCGPVLGVHNRVAFPERHEPSRRKK